MSNPLPADGQPISEGLVAAVDETVAELQGGVTYVLAAVIFGEAQGARLDIQSLTANRTRPFHWHREGPTTRNAAVKLVATHAIATKILAQRAGRHAQTATRATLLAQLAAELSAEGVEHVVIESRGQREDGRDRSVILDCFRGRPAPTFNYDWRTKAEPLLWYPDALAGTAREHLTDGQSAGFLLPAEHAHGHERLLRDRSIHACVSPGSRPRRSNRILGLALRGLRLPHRTLLRGLLHDREPEISNQLEGPYPDMIRGYDDQSCPEITLNDDGALESHAYPEHD